MRVQVAPSQRLRTTSARGGAKRYVSTRYTLCKLLAALRSPAKRASAETGAVTTQSPDARARTLTKASISSAGTGVVVSMLLAHGEACRVQIRAGEGRKRGND